LQISTRYQYAFHVFPKALIEFRLELFNVVDGDRFFIILTFNDENQEWFGCLSRAQFDRHVEYDDAFSIFGNIFWLAPKLREVSPQGEDLFKI
jgi:hypothetical protein